MRHSTDGSGSLCTHGLVAQWTRATGLPSILREVGLPLWGPQCFGGFHDQCHYIPVLPSPFLPYQRNSEPWRNGCFRDPPALEAPQPAPPSQEQCPESKAQSMTIRGVPRGADTSPAELDPGPEPRRGSAEDRSISKSAMRQDSSGHSRSFSACVARKRAQPPTASAFPHPTFD
jgi:hypothetical protein